MRSFPALIVFLMLAPGFVCAASCIGPKDAKTAEKPWHVDHFVFDASLHRDWKVMVDCGHPGVPARMELLPFAAPEQGEGKSSSGMPVADAGDASPQNDRESVAAAMIKSGDTVDVTSGVRGAVRVSIRGIAMQTAFPGQKIRVRLSANGRFVFGVVRGPHRVELSESAKPWGKP